MKKEKLYKKDKKNLKNNINKFLKKKQNFLTKKIIYNNNCSKKKKFWNNIKMNKNKQKISMILRLLYTEKNTKKSKMNCYN